MSQHFIYWPLLAQIALPIIILLLNGKRKSDDRKAGNVDAKKSAMDNTAWSKPVVLTSNNLANQAQLPVLFYVICLVLAAINAVGTLTLSLAWVFVISRYVHSYAHVTSNFIPARLGSFIFGAIVLMVLFGFTVAAMAKV